MKIVPMPNSGRMTWYHALSIVPDEPLLTAEGEAVAPPDPEVVLLAAYVD